MEEDLPDEGATSDTTARRIGRHATGTVDGDMDTTLHDVVIIGKTNDTSFLRQIHNYTGNGQLRITA